MQAFGRAAAAVVEAAVLACLLVGFWVTTLTGVSRSEMAVAVGSCVPAAVAGAAARRVLQGSWRPDLRLLGYLAWLPLSVVADTVRLVRMAAASGVRRWREPGRAGQGRPELTRIVVPAGAGAAGAGTEAEAILMVSATPGTYVVTIRELPGGRELTLHAAGSGWPHIDKRLSSR